MSDKIMPLSQAIEGYELFDKMKVQKGKFGHFDPRRLVCLPIWQWSLTHRVDKIHGVWRATCKGL